MPQPQNEELPPISPIFIAGPEVVRLIVMMRPLEPPYSLHTVLLKVLLEERADDLPERGGRDVRAEQELRGAVRRRQPRQRHHHDLARGEPAVKRQS